MSMVALFSVTSLATTYTSSLSIDFRSSVTGAARSYVGSTYKTANTLSSRSGISGGVDNYCDFRFQEKVGSIYSTKATRTLNLKTVGNTYSATYTGQSASGTFRYFIHNRYLSSDYKYTNVDGFTCNQVVMSSN